LLGRGPSGAELDDFRAHLNAAQQASPSVTTTNYNAAGTRSSSAARSRITRSSANTCPTCSTRSAPPS